MKEKLTKFLKEYVLYIAWLQALVATVGSLYFSLVKHYTPCDLCWYQRILMYPLVIVLGVGIMRKDKNAFWYSFPLTIIGFVIAAYHVLLQEGVIPKELQPCAASAVTCGAKYIQYLGFVTIPILSFTAFAIIAACLVLYKKLNKIK